MTCRRLDNNIPQDEILNSIDYVISDIDGVIWIGGKVLPKANELFSLLREKGKKIIFLSNDDTLSRKNKLRSFQKHGINASENEIFNSAYSAALYMRNTLDIPEEKSVYVVGMQGIVDELSGQGFNCLPIGPDLMQEDYMRWFNEGKMEDVKVGAVVVGLDLFVSYKKLLKAMTYLKDPEVPFITTHNDPKIIRPSGDFVPGPAGFISAVATVSGRSPILVGKPSVHAFSCLKSAYPDLIPSRCLMIGDCLHADMKFGRCSSMRTLFVLSGVDNFEDLINSQKDPNLQMEIPDYYTDSLETLYEHLLGRKS